MTVAMDSEERSDRTWQLMEFPETILMNRFNSELMQRAIDDLPVHYRETLLLVKWRKCRIRRSRKRSTIPMGTVMSRLARAR